MFRNYCKPHGVYFLESKTCLLSVHLERSSSSGCRYNPHLSIMCHDLRGSCFIDIAARGHQRTQPLLDLIALERDFADRMSVADLEVPQKSSSCIGHRGNRHSTNITSQSLWSLPAAQHFCQLFLSASMCEIVSLSCLGEARCCRYSISQVMPQSELATRRSLWALP